MIAERDMPAPGRRKPRPTGSLYEPFDIVTVRAPSLAVDAYRALPGLSPADPSTRRALAVGSEALLEAIERAPEEPAARRRLERKLRRFLIRMATRPTPYGLFAGVGLAHFGERTDLAIAEEPPRIRTRPDMAWLSQFVTELENRPEIRRALRFVANPLATRRGDRMVLHDWSGEGAEAVSIKATPPVLAALALATEPVSYTTLFDTLLATTAGANAEKVDGLLAHLATLTLLISDLKPPVLIANPARYVAERIAAIPDARDAAHQLDAVIRASSDFDVSPLADAAAAYRTLTALCRDTCTPAGNKGDAKPAVQVDMALSLTGGTISRAVGDETARIADLLMRLTPMPNGLGLLESYRQTFAAKYGRREVPLLELLDADLGLGSPLRGGNHGFGGHGHQQHGDAAKMQERNRTLLHAAHEAMRGQGATFELDAATIAKLSLAAPQAGAVPRTLDVNVFVAAESPAALDAGAFTVILGPNLGATSAGRNLARFADLLGDEATDALRMMADAEQDDRIWAEIVYQPSDSRMMNVTVRPRVRSHAIVLGVGPGVEPERVIPLNELAIGLHRGAFYARWTRNGREVVPCTGHMLNYNRAPLPLRFLDFIARERIAQFSSFDWGAAESLPYLPRVTSERAVLRPAEWKLDRFAAEHDLACSSPPDFAERLATWRARWRVPAHVFLASGDNRLALDLEDAEQAEELRLELKGLRDGWQVTLQEVLPALDQLWLRGPQGQYVSELVVSLRARETPERDAPPTPIAEGAPAGVMQTPVAVPHHLRYRAPGTEWLFAKIYAPRGAEDDLIAGPLRTFAARAVADARADRWFFLRYADPEPHLRLRFHGDPKRLTGELLPALCERLGELMEAGTCLRYAFDTYDREIERYGGTSAIELAERVFCVDSATVAEMLARAREERTPLDRTALAVASTDQFLDALGMTPPERLMWYKGEHGNRRDGSAEYRTAKTVLRALLGRATPGGEHAWLRDILESQRAELAEIGSDFAALERAGTLSTNVSTIARSLVHMHCNRISAENPQFERTVLALAARTWQGLLHERSGA